MEKDSKITYTKTGTEQLELLKDDYVMLLEKEIRRRKYVPGDEFIEITASDLKQASQFIKIYLPRRTSMLKLASFMYLVLGILMVLGGLFYNELRAAMLEDPTRAAIVLGGVMLSLISIITFWRVKRREIDWKQRKELDKNR